MQTTFKETDRLLPCAMMGSPTVLDEILFDVLPMHEGLCCVQDVFDSPMSNAVQTIEGIHVMSSSLMLNYADTDASL